MNKGAIKNNPLIKSKLVTTFIVVSSLLSITTIGSLFVLNSQLREDNKKLAQIEEKLNNNELNNNKQPEIDNDYIDEDKAKQIAKDEAKAIESKIKDYDFATSSQLNNKYNDLISKINNLNIPSSSGSTTIVNQTTGVEYEDIKSQIRDDFFPVGSLYCSMDKDFDPNVAWGGTWTKLDEGYFVEATQDETKINTQILAGLPNIVGYFSAKVNNSYQVGGAFSQTERGSKTNGDNGNYPSGRDFNARNGETKADGSTIKSSSEHHVYGNSDTVQPNAYYAYIWRRDS